MKYLIKNMHDSLNEGEHLVFIGSNGNYEIKLEKYEEFNTHFSNEALYLMVERRGKLVKIINLSRVEFVIVRRELI